MPYEGETLHLLGLGWGYGMLFIHTREYGTTGVRFPYEMTKPVVCDEDDGESDYQECVKKTTQTNLEYWGYARWHPRFGTRTAMSASTIFQTGQWIW